MTKPTFTNAWFADRIQPLWDLQLLSIGDHGRRPLTYLELGTYEGQSLCWMLDNVLTHPESTAIGVDPFIAVRRRAQHEMAAVRDRAISNLSLSQYKDRVTLIELTSREFLLSGVLGRSSIDILYIDGDHNAPAVLQDAVLGWPLVREGGLVIFDDYHLEADHQRKYPGVREAVEGILASFRRRYEVVWMTSRQVGLKKIRDF